MPKVIPLKLFLDMVPSSSEDVTRAIREQPTQLSRNDQRRNGNSAKSHFVCFDFQTTFHSRNVTSFCSLGLRLNCVRLAVHYFAVYSVLGRF